MNVKDLSVALVGTARYLDDSGRGPEIDAADVVVRVNWTFPIKRAFWPHVGKRADLLYFCRACHTERRTAESKGIPHRRLDQAYRVTVAERIAGEAWKEYRPNTGVVALFDCLDHGASEVRVYGFDFYASGWTRAEAQPRSPNQTRNTFPQFAWRHDPSRDREALADLMASEPRFRPDPTLRKVLEGIHVRYAARLLHRRGLRPTAPGTHQLPVAGEAARRRAGGRLRRRRRGESIQGQAAGGVRRQADGCGRPARVRRRCRVPGAHRPDPEPGAVPAGHNVPRRRLGAAERGSRDVGAAGYRVAADPVHARCIYHDPARCGVIPLAELKAYLGVAADDTTHDARLVELERNAVAFVETQTRRYFGPPDEFTEIIEGRGGRNLYLSEPPIEPPLEEGYDGYAGPGVPPLVIVDEREFPGADPVAIEQDTPTGFEVRTGGHEGWLVRLGRLVWTKGFEYTCTYYRGYPAGQEPGDIRQLILDLCSVKYSLIGQEALRSETIGGYSYTRFGETDLDAVMGGWATINAWRRLVFA